jgi:hypothetical protein
MTKLRWKGVLALGFLATAIVAGCGSDDAAGSKDEEHGGFNKGAFAPAGLGDLEACATSSAGGVLSPVNLVFMFDVSASLFSDPYTPNTKAKKWDPMVAASKAFFEDPQSNGLKASFDYFPQGFNGGEECNEASYGSAQIPLTPLPSQAFGAFFDNFKVAGNTTPTRAALTGAIGQAKTVAGQNAGTKTAVVFVTDGVPSVCGDGDEAELRLTETVARDAAAEVPTFVIGLGKSLTALNGIAEAGGTHAATLVDETTPAEQTRTAFRAALGVVSSQAGTCTFDLPAPPDGKTLNIDRVNVVFTPSGGQPDTVGFSEDCAAEGWRYDNRTAPKQVELCPTSCQKIRADKAGKIAIAFGCATKAVLK